MTKFKNFGGVLLSMEGSNTINRKQMIDLKLIEQKLIARNRDQRALQSPKLHFPSQSSINHVFLHFSRRARCEIC